jgi:glycosyltransferase involved in cell wall biosynthesis
MNESIPLVSVIIPSYNYIDYIDKCLGSVLSQDYSRIELIVVDDGSTDGTVEFLKSFRGISKLILQENRGVSIARNRGLLEANGDFIAFLDADDFWDISKISKQVKVALNTHADLVYSGVNLVDTEGVMVTGAIDPQYYGDCSPYFRKYPTRAIVTLGTSNALFRKSLVAQSGILDPALSISADWDFFRRYCDFAKVSTNNERLVFYRQHPQNMTTYSKSFVSDVVKMIIKMITDDRQKYSRWVSIKVFLKVIILLSKYRLKNFKKST